MLPLDDVVVAGTENPEGYVYAFDRDTCLVRWKRHCGRGVFAALVGDTSRLFAVTLQDTVLCFDPRTGTIRWSYSTGSAVGDTTDTRGNGRAPCLADSLLIYADHAGDLIALRAGPARSLEKSLPKPVRTRVYSHGSLSGRRAKLLNSTATRMVEPRSGFVHHEYGIRTCLR
jgi:hypothetical protein